MQRLIVRSVQTQTSARLPLLHARLVPRCSTRHYQQRSSARRAGTRMAAAAGQALPVPDVYLDGADAEVTKIQQHQRNVPRPSMAEEARTLFALAKHGILCTLSSQRATEGFPFGSVVEFASDEQGRPILATSSLSPHTADMRADGRCSFTVTAPSFQSLQDARFTLTGVATPVSNAERPAVRETFLARHPNAFYVDFGDFSFFRLEDLRGGRYVGGFGKVGSVSAQDYAAAAPDPVAAFSGPVCGHMNADHEADVMAVVKHYVGISNLASAKMLSIDRLGMELQCSRQEGAPFRLRLAFPRPADNRKAVKDVIVELTRTARAAEPAADGAAH